MCKYLSMLFLVISTKNGFKKAIVKERTPSEYMALAVKKTEPTKKKSSTIQQNTTKKHVIYSTR